MLVTGTLLRDGVALAERGELPIDVPLRASTEVRITIDRMGVVVAASSEIRRPVIERELLLDAGHVVVDSDAPARITTPRFRVEVNGAATISTRTVSVQRGYATVLGAEGQVIASRVEVGTLWEAPEARTIASKTTAGTLLAQAREAFNARDHVIAERRADAALDASPSRAQAAEARTILAECAHATGRLDDARARYEAIASRFADLRAGETALFAAARLEANRGRGDAARALFDRYLARYPSGRFADDARRQLHQ